MLALATAPAAAAPETPRTVHRVAGLERPVQLVVDKWGVPHIYALTTNDAFLAQGFNAARDRLFQMDLWLRKGTGRFLATANQFNIPADHPLYRKLSHEWADPTRHQRISEVLRSKPKSSVADPTALQNDQLSIPARRLLALLAPLTSDNPDTAAALKVLKGWNHVEGPESGQAALFENWFTGPLGRYFLYAAAPKEILEWLPIPDHQVLLDAMENPVKWFGPDGARVRDQLLLDSLGEAFAATKQQLGADPAKWKWGTLQHTLFWHPMSGSEPTFNVGPFPKGGSWHTVDLSYYLTDSYRQVGGATFRMVLDVGNWDASRVVNAPGQSGDPRSPGYRALAEKWRTGQYFPLVYSRAEVERNAAQRITLLPA
ncbi:penicillin acylase family protein [Amycolatopsis suaedae]|uniref:penicillin acylase family protein n=1 Tax=Amycolatopsis suaedae TaxID=2510978 RepID=UPI0013EF2B5D|nr:penicillin acylase family protein [Amycolatopsis suaedae]